MKRHSAPATDENQSLPDLLARKELLPSPCPLCGDDVAKGSFWFSAKPRAPDAPELYEVFCLECEFDGPSRPTLDEAIEAWNRRAPSPDLLARLREEGWMLVPREPTPEMLGAFWRVKNGHHFADEPEPTDTSDYAAYRAMISASPARAVLTPLKKEEGVSSAAQSDAQSAPVSEAAALLERLRPLIEAANEPPPKPLPEQDSRVGEAMAGQADAAARNAWRSRMEAARATLCIELAKGVNRDDR